MAISQDTENNEQKQETTRTLAEWVSFSIASLILAVIISLVIYTAINDKQQPPFISITQKQINRKSNGHYYVPFEIVNKGDITAESVQILAELKINNKVEEIGEQQIDFLSSGEKEEGTFIFANDPYQGELKIRVASYK
ncbi:hypothetical protein NIES4101_38890 [Calothrix sp. NIES-4101]|nr:hypothetical protein NIES4101_38890 [Calothrix sp. NIES-4101]